MPRKDCPACVHPERALIDRALLEYGQSPRSLVRRYRDLSRLAVQKHRDGCLAKPAEAA